MKAKEKSMSPKPSDFLYETFPDVMKCFMEQENIKLEVAWKETFSLKEASTYLKISIESVLYYARRKRELSYSAIGKHLVFSKIDLDEFIEQKRKIGMASIG